MELFLDQYMWVNLAALIFNNFSVLLGKCYDGHGGVGEGEGTT